MANVTKSMTFLTTDFILSYPKLFKPEPYMENGKPKGDPQYGFEAISEKDSLKEWLFLDKDTGDFLPVNVEQKLVALAKSLWGDDFDVVAAVKHGGLSWPFKSGDKKADDKGERADHYRGKKYWRSKALAVIAGNPNEPTLYYDEDGLVRINKGTPSGDQMIGNKFYGGAICTAELNAVAGETAQGKYVTFYVNSVVF